MNKGKLYVIATPIGNMDDITLRALGIMKNDIDIVYCEDTRQTSKLLRHYGIDLKMISFHSHSSDQKLERVKEYILSGNTAAYITDSGTPGISDPGSKLVNYLRKADIEIIPLPGPSALSTLVSVSGFPNNNIFFTGFLSKKKGKRRKELQKLEEFNGIIVIYESPYRIKKILEDINFVFPEKEIIIGREMTKFYEEFITGKVSDVFNEIDNIKEKGEFALAILNN